MFKTKIVTSALAGLTLATFMAMGSGPAFAQTAWQRNHPARAAFNHRYRRENRRINQGIRRGQINPNEANQLRSENRSIYGQEMNDARANGGALTRGERQQLHQEQNSESRSIYQDRRNGY